MNRTDRGSASVVKVKLKSLFSAAPCRLVRPPRTVTFTEVPKSNFAEGLNTTSVGVFPCPTVPARIGAGELVAWIERKLLTAAGLTARLNARVIPLSSGIAALPFPGLVLTTVRVTACLGSATVVTPTGLAVGPALTFLVADPCNGWWERDWR